MNVLFLSYDGLLDPLGRSQVVPYLEGLATKGVSFDLITFEKPGRWRALETRTKMAARLRDAGVTWHPLPYHRTPSAPATAFDLYRGYGTAAALWPKGKWALVHARSYPPALIAQRLRKRKGVPFLFDMRGFYPEERVDGGLWRKGGVLFRLAKRLEKGFLRDASGVVTLTEASLPVLHQVMEEAGAHGQVRVIPTSVDLRRFQILPNPAVEPFVLSYFGSIGTWYLLDEMLLLGRTLLETVPDSRLRFLVNGGVDALRDAAARIGVPRERIEIRSVSHEEVPGALKGASATYFLINPCPSKVSSAATKFGESLALGLPVLLNRGVGDSAGTVDREGVGVVVKELSIDGYREAIPRLLALARDPTTGRRCRRVAEEHYDLEKAVASYASLYRNILGEGGEG